MTWHLRSPGRPAHRLTPDGASLCGLAATGWSPAPTSAALCARCSVLDAREVDSLSILAVTGLTYRQLDFWCRRGYLRPASATPGSGYRRRFPAAELAVATVMARLVDAGLTPAAACRVARGQPLAPGVSIVLDPAPIPAVEAS